MTDAFLRIESLRKEFGATPVVNGLDLDIQRGEFVSLLGASGCGKTTTLQMIAGFEKPTSGRIWLNGKDITDVPPSKREIGIVFQNYALFPHMTVEENILFGLVLRKVEQGCPAQTARGVARTGSPGRTGSSVSAGAVWGPTTARGHCQGIGP